MQLAEGVEMNWVHSLLPFAAMPEDAAAQMLAS